MYRVWSECQLEMGLCQGVVRSPADRPSTVYDPGFVRLARRILAPAETERWFGFKGLARSGRLCRKTRPVSPCAAVRERSVAAKHLGDPGCRQNPGRGSGPCLHYSSNSSSQPIPCPPCCRITFHSLTKPNGQPSRSRLTNTEQLGQLRTACRRLLAAHQQRDLLTNGIDDQRYAATAETCAG